MDKEPILPADHAINPQMDWLVREHLNQIIEKLNEIIERLNDG